jgi:hypothetical protein
MNESNTGTTLSFYGSLLNSIGAIINALGYHNEAFIVWFFGNPMLMIWAFGYWKGYWNGGMPAVYITLMYGIFMIFNFYAILGFTV